MSSEYIGWVPTATGNLSFSIIGTGRNPKKLYKNYYSENNKKFTIAVQNRKTSDRIGYKGARIRTYTFIYLAVSFLNERHFWNHGVVYFLPSKEYWRYSYLVESIGSKPKAISPFGIQFQQAAKALKTEWSKRHIVSINTVLDREGKLVIDLSDNEFWEDEEGTVANQIYYFIRDITHTHQHHEPSSDTILKAYADRKLRNDSNSNWKRETLYALHKFIIQQKRGKRYEALIRCQGILAYARAFSELHVKSDEDDVPRYLETPLQNSLRSSAAEAENRIPKTASEIVFGGILPLLSFAVAYLSFTDGVPTNDPNWQSRTISFIIDWTNRNPLIVVFSPFVPYFLYLSSLKIRDYAFPLMRPIQRILLSFGYEKSLALVGSLFGITLIISVWAFFKIFP